MKWSQSGTCNILLFTLFTKAYSYFCYMKLSKIVEHTSFIDSRREILGTHSKKMLLKTPRYCSQILKSITNVTYTKLLTEYKQTPISFSITITHFPVIFPKTIKLKKSKTYAANPRVKSEMMPNNGFQLTTMINHWRAL